MAGDLPDLSLTDWAVLGVVVDLGPTHGWSVVRELAPDAPLGRIWTVSRPLVYRSLGTLTNLGYVEEAGDAPSEAGPRRTIVRATRKGRAALRRFVVTPVEHVRDVRNGFLLKLALLDRMGQPSTELLERQLQALEPVFAAARSRSGETGFEADLATWRREQTLAVARFLRATLERQ
jgi:DNA-binding PadR family transcriptional regulator